MKNYPWRKPSSGLVASLAVEVSYTKLPKEAQEACFKAGAEEVLVT